MVMNELGGASNYCGLL